MSWLVCRPLDCGWSAGSVGGGAAGWAGGLSGSGGAVAWGCEPAPALPDCGGVHPAREMASREKPRRRERQEGVCMKDCDAPSDAPLEGRATKDTMPMISYELRHCRGRRT